VSAAELAGHRIVVGLASWVRRPVEEWLEAHGTRMSHTVEVTSFAQVRAGVLEKLGVGFVPRYLVEEDFTSGRLAELDCGDLHIVGETHVIFRPNVTQSARWLVDKLIETAAEANTRAAAHAPRLLTPL
jgi:DNA-binding transcriptional LysR family regulator